MGSSITYSSPGYTQARTQAKGDTINHGAMRKQHDAKHGMICGMGYAMHMHVSERKYWTRPQLGKPIVSLERGVDFGQNRYKDHRNRMHGLQMASKTIMAQSCDNSTRPSKCTKKNKLLHSNIATKHMEVIHSRCLTKDEHWAMANSSNNKFKQAWQKCKW